MDITLTLDITNITNQLRKVSDYHGTNWTVAICELEHG